MADSDAPQFRRFRWSETDRAGDGGRAQRLTYRFVLWLGLWCSPTGHWQGVCTRCARKARGSSSGYHHAETAETVTTTDLGDAWRGRSEPPAHVTRVANDDFSGRAIAERGEAGLCEECGQVRQLWRWVKTPWRTEPGNWWCFDDLDAVGGFVEIPGPGAVD